MSQPEWTFLRFVNRVLRNLRKPTITDVNDSTNSRIAQDVIEVTREEYQELCSRQDWHWLRKTAHLTVNEEIIGTASFTIESATINTFSPFPSWANFSSGDDVEGGVKLYVDENQELYTLNPGWTALGGTVDRPFTGTTGTGKGCTMLQDTYVLAEDFGRFLDVNKYFGRSDIELVGIQKLREMQFTGYGSFALGSSYGPRYASLIDKRKVLFWPWPKEYRSIQYDYIRVPEELNGNDAMFAIPHDDMSVLLHRVMMIMYGYIEDDTRANTAAQLFAEKYGEMSGSKTNVDDVLQFYVMNRDRALHRRSRRGRYGSVDWGKRFDRWP